MKIQSLLFVAALVLIALMPAKSRAQDFSVSFGDGPVFYAPGYYGPGYGYYGPGYGYYYRRVYYRPAYYPGYYYGGYYHRHHRRHHWHDEDDD